MPIPLDKRTVVSKDPGSGKSKTFPLLHPNWKEDIQFVLYRPPPKDASLNSADYQEWLERVTFLEEDLHWLLTLPHDKFWCQAIFDETLQKCLESYLRYAPRSFDGLYRLPDSVRDKHLNLHRQVFMAFVRLATYKESKDAHITPHVFGEILYENFIFDVPKLMDLSVLYWRGNLPLLQKMVENIFTQQPKYEDDLRATLPTILQVFDCISHQCGVHVGSTPGSPQKLTNSKGSQSDEEVRDILNYLHDTCETLYAFFEVYPQVALAFHEQHMEIRLASFYESVPSKLREVMKERELGTLGVQVELRKKLHRSKVLMVKIIRKILFTSCLQPIFDQSDGSNHEILIEDYLQTLAGILNERRFIADYEASFPLDDDLDILSQSSYAVDDTRIEFLQEAVADACFSYGKKRKVAPKIEEVPSSPEGATANGDMGMFAGAAGGEMTDDYEELGACAPSVTGVELHSLISSVKDLLPHLGTGFIQVCLEEFNYNAEDTINALLEDRLPPSLMDLDRNRERPATPPQPTSVLSTRHNVYDNDAFDVFSRDEVDTTQIHKGKKNKTEDMAILDDKSDLANFREVYNMYGHMDADSMYETGNIEYDDEYDDTYDSHEVGADDADSADELTKKFVVNRLNVLKARPQKVENEDVEDEEEEDRPERRRENFIEDPAKIRERRAQQYANRRGRGNARPHDVRGAPKGKGQEKDVEHNRAYKDKNKSRMANHNRRAMADRKRQKGMGPLS